MRNVFIYEHKECSFPGLKISSGYDGRNLFSINPYQGKLYVYSDGTVHELCPHENTSHTLFDVKQYYENEEKIPSLVGLCYLSITEILCLAFDNGDLLTKNCLSGEVECSASIQSGIRMMEWSSDQDVVVLLTLNDMIVTMSGTFDLISETDLQQRNFGGKQFITVGWGKKETQFHGSEGKAAAKVIEPDSHSLYDERSPQISWRGDSSLFAVNFVNVERKERLVRVFNRQGDLQYTSEHIPGLGGVISWRPSGNLIACTQCLPNKHVVCFLEKNGLKHGDFALPFPINTTFVHQLLWNAESTMLLAWCEALNGSSLPGLSTGQHSLLVWTSNNYHWYLKKRIDLDLDCPPISVIWDQLCGNRLHVLCREAMYICYEFSWCVDHSCGLSSQDWAFVGVIDGDALLVTSFRHSVIPPPMCGTTLKLPSQASSVIFAPGSVTATNSKCLDSHESSKVLSSSFAEDSGFGETVENFGSNSNNFCVWLSSGVMAAFSFVGGSLVSSPSHVSVGMYHLQWDNEETLPHHCLHHWCWITRDLMMCSATTGDRSKLCILDMESVASSENGHIIVRKQIPLATTVLSITSGTNGKGAIIQLSDETILHYDICDGSLLPLFSLPQPAVQLLVCSVSESLSNMTEMVISLSGHNRLYADTSLIKNNVTSVALHSQFLLITTSQHELICCPLRKSSILNLVENNKETSLKGVSGASSRRVERGSRLIVAVPESNRVILQMPRGNLECIQPRALTLHQLAALLNTSMYREAFDLARKQRVNLNLLIDHDPVLFMHNVDIFVNRVSNAQWLSLFLTELEEEDCTLSMYQAHYSQPRPSSLKEKVHTVCDAIVSAVSRLQESVKNSTELTLPILTGLIRKKTLKDLEVALTIVKRMKSQEEHESNAMHWSHALRHLLYLRDVDELMDTALGMYDFDLVLLVASRSQKDPKEYLAFLNNLRSMEPNYQRYSIDKHLQKWEAALSHLVHCAEQHTEELLNFVKSHDLFKTALMLLSKNDVRYKMIAVAYADQLRSLRLYKEAGMMYRRASDFESALQVHRKALAWRNCIQDANKADLSDADRKELLENICCALVDSHQHSEAAVIQEVYLKNPEEAIKILCCGSQWGEAVRIAHISGVSNIIETTVVPCAIDSCVRLQGTIKGARDQFIGHLNRLKEVRLEKEKSLEQQSREDPDHQGESDFFSDTSSVISESSASSRSSCRTSSTSKSGKNRRKHQRRVLSLKRGSRFEELALMRALHQEVTELFALREDVHAVNCILFDFESDENAFKLQEELRQTLKLMEHNFTEIWPSYLAAGGSSESSLTSGPLTTSNMIALNVNAANSKLIDMAYLEPQYRFSPVIQPVRWELDVLRVASK